jgi:hypothetical protein
MRRTLCISARIIGGDTKRCGAKSKPKSPPERERRPRHTLAMINAMLAPIHIYVLLLFLCLGLLLYVARHHETAAIKERYEYRRLKDRSEIAGTILAELLNELYTDEDKGEVFVRIPVMQVRVNAALAGLGYSVLRKTPAEQLPEESPDSSPDGAGV